MKRIVSGKPREIVYPKEKFQVGKHDLLSMKLASRLIAFFCYNGATAEPKSLL
jgi:hypothetical protein